MYKKETKDDIALQNLTPQWVVIQHLRTKNDQSTRRVDPHMTNGGPLLSKLPAQIVPKLENCFIHESNSRDLVRITF